MVTKPQSAVDELGQFVPLLEFQARPEIARFHPSLASLRWVLHQQRAVFDRHRALARIAGRVHVHPERFAQALLEIASPEKKKK